MSVTVYDDGFYQVRSHPENFNRRNRFEVWKMSTNVKLGEFFMTGEFLMSASTLELDTLLKARLKEFGVL